MTHFSWFEYASDDAPRAQAFFGEVLGWSTTVVPLPDRVYTAIATGERLIGGYLSGDANARWLAHLVVADVHAAAARVTAHGGTLMKPPFAAGTGTKALVRDPDGAELALFQPNHPTPPVVPVDGTFCWSELFAGDPRAAFAFYQAVGETGAQTMELPGFGTYHLLTSDDQPIGGVTAPMPGLPLAWLSYVQVASTDATVAHATRLGATIVEAPTDVDGIGRVAIFIDPQGAPLGILQPPPSA